MKQIWDMTNREMYNVMKQYKNCEESYEKNHSGLCCVISCMNCPLSAHYDELSAYKLFNTEVG